MSIYEKKKEFVLNLKKQQAYNNQDLHILRVFA